MAAFVTHYEDATTLDQSTDVQIDNSIEVDISALYPKKAKRANKASELLLYLKAVVAPPHTDILQWWKVMVQIETKFAVYQPII